MRLPDRTSPLPSSAIGGSQLVPMPVMLIGRMRMAVLEDIVLMPMGMRIALRV